jgi:hypothetical protein
MGDRLDISRICHNGGISLQRFQKRHNRPQFLTTLKFALFHFLQTAKMARRLTESGAQKIAHAVPRNGDSCRLSPEAEDVHIVILYTLARRKIVVAERRARAIYFTDIFWGGAISRRPQGSKYVWRGSPGANPKKRQTTVATIFPFRPLIGS